MRTLIIVFLTLFTVGCSAAMRPIAIWTRHTGITRLITASG